MFSGFSKDINLEDVLKYSFPLADGYEGFWTNDVAIQHPLADIEIVAWDSSLTLFISRNDSLVQRFRKSFTLSENLSLKNTLNNSQINHIGDLLIKELTNKNIVLTEENLNKKYIIWNRLYSERQKDIEEQDILKYIDETTNLL